MPEMSVFKNIPGVVMMGNQEFFGGVFILERGGCGGRRTRASVSDAHLWVGGCRQRQAAPSSLTEGDTVGTLAPQE